MHMEKNPITNLHNIHLDTVDGLDAAVQAFNKGDLPVKAAYYLDCDVLRKQSLLFQQSFPGTIAYAVKANYDPQVLHTLWESGIRCFDVASLKEMELISKQFKNKKEAPALLFHNPWKSKQEIQKAYYDYNVRHFAAGSVEEIEKIQQVTQNDPEVSYSLRLNVGGNAVFSLKEGGAELADAVSMLEAVRKTGEKFGWHFHLGSQCEDPVDYIRALETVSNLIGQSQTMPDYIDIGGGFPAAYANHPPNLQVFFKAVKDANRYNVPLICEPGRSLVASCQKSLVPIKNIDRKRNMVVLTDGRYGSLAEFVASQGKLKPSYSYIGMNGTTPSSIKNFDVQGPTCNIKGEHLPFELALPENAADGDLIVFDDIGAYNVVQQSSFNGYEPEIQFVSAGHPQLDRKPSRYTRILSWAVAASTLLGVGTMTMKSYQENKQLQEKSISLEKDLKAEAEQNSVMTHIYFEDHPVHVYHGPNTIDTAIKRKANAFRKSLAPYCGN